MALRINSIDIFLREAHICVSIGNEFPKTVSSACAQYILQQYPQLANHACFSGGARVFGQVIQGTSVPHVLEHLIIHDQLLQCAHVYRTSGGASGAVSVSSSAVVSGASLSVVPCTDQAHEAHQIHAVASRDTSLQPAETFRQPSALRLVGCTTWNNDEHTSALIRVMFYDDLVLLRALRTQTAFLNKVLKQCS